MYSVQILQLQTYPYHHTVCSRYFSARWSTLPWNMVWICLYSNLGCTFNVPTGLKCDNHSNNILENNTFNICDLWKRKVPKQWGLFIASSMKECITMVALMWESNIVTELVIVATSPHQSVNFLTIDRSQSKYYPIKVSTALRRFEIVTLQWLCFYMQ